jgi:DNA anti-recombination protein RmuC
MESFDSMKAQVLTDIKKQLKELGTAVVSADDVWFRNLGKDLYNRLSTLGGYFVDLRKGLDKAVSAYNSAVGSLESRVFVVARKFKDLQLGMPVEIENLEGVEVATRQLQAPELIRTDTMPLFEPSEDVDDTIREETADSQSA